MRRGWAGARRGGGLTPGRSGQLRTARHQGEWVTGRCCDGCCARSLRRCCVDLPVDRGSGRAPQEARGASAGSGNAAADAGAPPSTAPTASAARPCSAGRAAARCRAADVASGRRGRLEGRPRPRLLPVHRGSAAGPDPRPLLTARLDQPGLVLDQVSGPTASVACPARREWLRADQRRRRRERRLLRHRRHRRTPRGGRRIGNAAPPPLPPVRLEHAFLIDSGATACAMPDAPRSRRGRTPAGGPPSALTNFNSPAVAPAGIGLYTAAWGRHRPQRVADRATGRAPGGHS